MFKIIKTTRLIVIALSLTLMSTIANASLVKFDITDDNGPDFSWELELSPIPDFFSDNGFRINSPVIEEVGVGTFTADRLTFFSEIGGRGLDLTTDTANFSFYSSSVFFSGDTSTPKFEVGVYSVDAVNGSGQLVISAVNVSSPSTFLFLVISSFAIVLLRLENSLTEASFNTNVWYRTN